MSRSMKHFRLTVLAAADTVLAVIPMFHANAWGLPYTAALTGAGLVFPGPHPEPATLLELCQRERVTFSAGVPTVWLGVLERLVILAKEKGVAVVDRRGPLGTNPKHEARTAPAA